VSVYLIMQEGFDVRAYQPHLQCLADGKMQLQEGARFNDAVDLKATGKSRFRVSDYDIWFDFTSRYPGQNIVLFTLDAQKRDALLARLYVVTATWAANNKKAS